MKKTFLPRLGAAVLGASLASPVFAGMGNAASLYGLLPTDVASAQALSLFNSQASAVYYNPGYLTKDPRGELSLGLLHGEHELRAESQGGAAPAERDGDVLNDTDTQQQIIALKTDLSDMTKFDFPIYFGMVAGVEKFSREMLAFNSRVAREGQFISYGRQPLFLNLGGGMESANGISAGVSALITLRSDAELQATSRLDGETTRENLSVQAKPIIRPVIGLNFEWSKVFCGHDGCGIWDGWETAFAFRGHTEQRTTVDSQINIPGAVARDDAIVIFIDTLDSYQPDIFSAGLQYRFNENLRVGVTVEQQMWSDLEEELEGDTVKDQADPKFIDTTVPRLGAEWQVNKHLTLIAGVAREESPLDSTQTLDVNYLDSDKTIVGLGGALTIHEPPILAFPMKLSFGYQYQQLDDRDFELTSSDPSAPANPYETVTADGDVHVFSGSVTVKF